MAQIDKRPFQFFDYGLLFVTLFIPAFALLILYSAGFDPDGTGIPIGFFTEPIKSVPFVKQLQFLGIGLFAIAIGVLIPHNSLQRFSYIIYTVCLVLLIVVMLMGSVARGSQRWIPLGGFNLQPSEVVKAGVVFVMARYLSRHAIPVGGLGLKQLILPSLLIGIPMAFVIEQPDLGTALVIGATGGLMLLFVGVRPKVLISLVLGAIILAVPAWSFLHPYQKRRVFTLIDPQADPLGSGYHLAQSKIAVGSGELLGKGFMQGTQTQLEFLPEHHTDFVFSVLAEEFGFIGSAFVILCYLALIALILRVAMRSKDLFCVLVCVGVASLFFFHVFVNIGMVIGILPVVGITLPLFSYGGSSLLISLYLLGVVLGISMRRYQFSPG